MACLISRERTSSKRSNRNDEVEKLEFRNSRSMRASHHHPFRTPACWHPSLALFVPSSAGEPQAQRCYGPQPWQTHRQGYTQNEDPDAYTASASDHTYRHTRADRQTDMQSGRQTGETDMCVHAYLRVGAWMVLSYSLRACVLRTRLSLTCKPAGSRECCSGSGAVTQFHSYAIERTAV